MLHMKATLDMKVAAATCGYQLHMTEPEIDNNGFDFTIAHRYDHLHVQNKATISGAGVRSWDFHPLLFQVPFLERDISPCVDGYPVGGTEGAMGGALLHVVSKEAAEDGRLDVKYYYFDIFYVAAVEQGLWVSEKFGREEAQSILRKIRNGNWSERINLPLRAFLPISSPAAILAFRFHMPRPSNYVSMGHKCPNGLEELWRAEVRHWLPPDALA
ncbi:hypothetical protein AGRHK599_LOCUS281 [Rhizobium rhizogenes]|uniref:Uncharacterized protein n=1 Tax=Rhizobium rhizogenes TaxID=359 RepID=A0AAN1ZZP1_RHIRH|nr:MULTISPECIES: hypothetical protein [Rhizobium/Agrobacterium group]MCZ7441734.1 hypothetical protein [Rhizobium rhizogenes]NSZ78056.1 hypothetical protein [Agrobacterium tumefaciens]CAD0210266.1 hypothetical protein AGRHK599_LOCUS281 [Rhizobium rhizogenes]